ncbi:protein rep [Pseudonocardia kongjuensis]|uniref:protein rep n=1 Tax=Pseudonocardia kongjuensis TaxID=102227 RepID=UPI0031E33A44
MTSTGIGGPVLRVSEGPDGSRRAGVAGLQSCGSPWSCPVCARKIAAERAAEVRDVLGAVAETGGSIHLLTFTMRHHRRQSLAELWDALSRAWRAVTSGRSVERERDRWGVLGMVRVVEATHGEHGWHLHVHALIAFDTPVSRELVAELGGAMFGRWERALVRTGLAAPLEHRGGLDVRPVDLGTGSLDAMAEYLAKITVEITGSAAKAGRRGNRTPFAILRDALATGLADDVELWLEWEQVSRGRRQIAWSRGFREWAGAQRERTDDEIAADDRCGQNLLTIDPEDWPQVRDRLAELLDATERDGLTGATAWLTAHGLRWSSATPRRHPPRPPGQRTAPGARSILSLPATTTGAQL